MTEHRCPTCDSPTTYKLFSGGKEWYCGQCHTDGEYESGEAPRRVQLIQDGKFEELRAEMYQHFHDDRERGDCHDERRE